MSALEYQEWRPSDALRGTVLAFWTVSGDGRSVPSPTILPDPYVEIVFNLGDPVTLLGPQFVARQPSRAVVGLLARAVPMRYGRRVRTVGIRLHPARAASFLGAPSISLANTLTPLRRLARAFDARLAQWLRTDPDLRLHGAAGPSTHSSRSNCVDRRRSIPSSREPWIGCSKPRIL